MIKILLCSLSLLATSNLALNYKTEELQKLQITVYDMNGGKKVASYQDQEKINLFSANKLFIIHTLLQEYKLNLEEEIPLISAQKEKEKLSKFQRSSHLINNKKYPINLLLKSCFLENASDSCLTVIDHVSNEAEVLKKIQEQLKKLKLNNTQFTSLFSTNIKDNYSNLADTTTLMSQLLKNKDLVNLLHTNSLQLEKTAFTPKFYQEINKNKLTIPEGTTFAFFDTQGGNTFSILLNHKQSQNILSLHYSPNNNHLSKHLEIHQQVYSKNLPQKPNTEKETKVIDEKQDYFFATLMELLVLFLVSAFATYYFITNKKAKSPKQ